MRFAVVVLLASCGFRLPASDDVVDARGDAPSDALDGAASDGPPRIACQTPYSSDLVACYELEDDVTDGVLLDSSAARRDATASGLVPQMRGTSMAAGILPTSRVYAPDSPAFDLATGYTLAVWMRPHTQPAAGAVQGILDHELQYAMLLGTDTSNGEFQARCVHTGVSRYEWTTSPPLDTWSLFVCTYDGVDFCAYRYTTPSDHQHFCHRPTQPPANDGNQGLAIGHLSAQGLPAFRFDGWLDGIQVFHRALTAAEICTTVGQSATCLPCDACSM